VICPFSFWMKCSFTSHTQSNTESKFIFMLKHTIYWQHSRIVKVKKKIIFVKFCWQFQKLRTILCSLNVLECYVINKCVYRNNFSGSQDHMSYCDRHLQFWLAWKPNFSKESWHDHWQWGDSCGAGDPPSQEHQVSLWGTLYLDLFFSRCIVMLYQWI